MAEDQATKFELRGPAAWITLSSPATRNALSTAMVAELAAHLESSQENPAVRAIVITGEGPAFCAGADLKNRGDMGDSDRKAGNPFVDILKLMREGAKPVIGAINGHAFGGGLGLVAACDIAIASEEAKFSFSEVRVGVVPAMISVVVIPKLGVHQTMRLFLTGDRFSAADAVGYGLLHRCVSAAELEAAVNSEIDMISKGGPNAVREAKRLVRTVSALPEDEAFAYAEAKIAELFASEEAAEGMSAFVEKRPARWIPEK